MPDIDSLPPSYSPSRVNGSDSRHSPSRMNGPDNHNTPSPRASSTSLAAAAIINAGDSRRGSTVLNRDRGPPPYQFGQSERRRSSAFLNSYDPTLPGPGELQTGDLRLQTGDDAIPLMSPSRRTASPFGAGSPTFPSRYRDRNPSLGELHQQLEQEHEAQVLRLLGVIRQAQDDLQMLRDQAAIPDSNDMGNITPPAMRLASSRYDPLSSHPPAGDLTSRPIRSQFIPGSVDRSRRSSHRSRTPSRAVSPSLRNASNDRVSFGEMDFFYGGQGQSLTDENAYFQAETQNLTRENQMLRQRIRELERQISGDAITTTNSPVIPSNLSCPPMDAENADAILANGSRENIDKDE